MSIKSKGENKMKYLNQKRYVEKYETMQVTIDERLIDYIKDELLSDNDINVNLINEVLIEYLYNKNEDIKSQLNNEQLLLVESGEIELYKQSIKGVVDDYILDNGREVGWSNLLEWEVIEEWITRN
jgi:hypothetical protein